MPKQKNENHWIFKKVQQERAINKHIVEQVTEKNVSYKKYEKYKYNLLGFCQDILKHSYPPDIEKVFYSLNDNITTLVKSSNAYGKSFAIADIAIAFWKCFPDSQVFIAAAPPDRNLQLIWKRIQGTVARLPFLFEFDEFKNLEISSKFNTESFIKGLSIPTSGPAYQKEAKFSGKHAPNMLFACDEGDAIPSEVYQGIESCMSGGYCRMVIPFNPRSATGVVYNKERDKKGYVIELDAFNHPNVIEGRDVFPGCVTREVTVRRINEWTRPLMNGEPLTTEVFQVPDFLIGCTAKREDNYEYPPLEAGFRIPTEPWFNYMVRGKYPVQGTNQLINKMWVDAARDRWDQYVAALGEVPPQDEKPIMGLDVAEMGRDRNIALLRYGDFVPRLTSEQIWGGTDVPNSASNAIKLYKAKNCQSVMIDALNMGSAVAPLMVKESCIAYGIKVTNSPTITTEIGNFEKLRDQLYWQVRNWLEKSPFAKLPPDEELIEELLTPTYDTATGKIKIMPKKVMREMLKRSPDKLDALMLTFAQESDKLLHFYDHCMSATIDMDRVNITCNENEVPQVIKIKDLMDYGFIATNKQHDAWSFIRVWTNTEGLFIIPEVYRLNRNDINAMVDKVYEAHKNRPFISVGVFSEDVKELRTSWNILEDFLYKQYGNLRMPELMMIKNVQDRETRQLHNIRMLTKTKSVAANVALFAKDAIWNQLANYTSVPDDVRDALAGAYLLVNREIG